MTRLTRCTLGVIALCLCAWWLTGCGAGDDDIEDPGNGNNGELPPPGATAAGRVVDMSSERPIAGALVTLGGQTTTTDALGQFSFSDVPIGEQTIIVSAPGFIFGGAVTVTIEEGPNDLGTVHMTPSGEGPPPPPPI